MLHPGKSPELGGLSHGLYNFCLILWLQFRGHSHIFPLPQWSPSTGYYPRIIQEDSAISTPMISHLNRWLPQGRSEGWSSKYHPVSPQKMAHLATEIAGKLLEVAFGKASEEASSRWPWLWTGETTQEIMGLRLPEFLPGILMDVVWCVDI